MHGEMYHKMLASVPQHGQQPVYAQLYINDDQAALTACNNKNSNLNPFLMGELQDILISNNPFVPLYKQVYQIMQETPPELQSNFQMTLVLQQGDDCHQYNLPTVDDVAAMIPGTGEEDIDYNRDIVLHYNHGSLQQISHLHPLYTPLHYILLFPTGDQGWHRNIDIVQPENAPVCSKHVSQRCYSAFHLHPHPMESSDLFRGSRLFQQYLVDTLASIESSKLYWIHNNQKTIRADLYDGLRDTLRGVQNVDASQMGKCIVLLASHCYGSTW